MRATSNEQLPRQARRTCVRAPPAAGLSPRLAPVFPLGRAAEPQLDSEASQPESFPTLLPVAHDAPPEARSDAPTPQVTPQPADAPERGVTVSSGPAESELREIHVERRVRDTTTPVATEHEPRRIEIRTHERTAERGARSR